MNVSDHVLRSTNNRSVALSLWIIAILICIHQASVAIGQVEVNLSAVETEAEVNFDTAEPGLVTVNWPVGGGALGHATFRLTADRPLIESFAIRPASGESPVVIGRKLRPFTALTVGTRDLDTPGGWTITFST